MIPRKHIHFWQILIDTHLTLNAPLVIFFLRLSGGHGGAADAKQSAFMTSLAFDFMFKTLSENARQMD